MRCHVVALLIAGALSGAAASDARIGYGFEFWCRSDTVKQVPPGGEAVFWFTLANTGAASDAFRFDCRVIEHVPGATVIYCVNGQCAEPGLPLYDSLPAGAVDTAIDVSVYAGQTAGTEVVLLSVRSLGDSALADSVRTWTVVGSGVAEGTHPAQADAPGLRVAPSPTAGRMAVVSFVLPGSAPCRLELWDVTGVRVGTLCEGPAGPGRHEVRWRAPQEMAAGVYLLRLAAGSAVSACPVLVD